MKRNIIEEISSLKSRDEFLQRHNFEERLSALENLLINTNELTEGEVCRYVPIALVACFEGFFRSSYSEIIDFGSPYRENVTKFNQANNIKLDFNIVNAIQDDKISVGEFISHLLPCNNFNDINSNMSALLDCEFSKAIKGFNSESIFEDINKTNQEFNVDSDKILKNIVQIFKLRHIFCHEFANHLIVEKSEILSLFFSAKVFLRQVNDYIWCTLYPNAPETQADMNSDSFQDAQNIDDELCDSLHLIKSHDFMDNMRFDIELFDESILKWKEYREAEAKLQASTVEGGTMYPLLYASSLADTTKRKLKELKKDYHEAFKVIG